MITRRHVCIGIAGALAAPYAARAATPPAFSADFDMFWKTLDEGYCFFDEKATDWARVREVYGPRATAAASPQAFGDVLALALNELYDTHTHLSDPPEGSRRWPPFDLLVAAEGGGARVLEVRTGSAAARAGLAPGVVISAVDGVPVAEAAAAAMPACLGRRDLAAEAYALNVAVAGRRGMPRLLRLGSGAELDLPLLTGADEPDISYRWLDGEIGLIRIASFASMDSITVFDAALAQLRQARGLVLDVRRNGGGDTAVARPIMGRFISKEAPYAQMRRREGRGLGPAWIEYVEPRGPFTYEGPVVVLTDRWSASMAEGFPMGMRGLGRARIVGRPMMGLGAAVLTIELPNSGLSLQYSAEPVYDVAGRPRWTMSPDVETQPGADELAAGLVELRRMIAG